MTYEEEMKLRVEYLWMLYHIMGEYFEKANIKSSPSKYFNELTLGDLRRHWRNYLWAVEDDEFFCNVCAVASQIIS